MHKFQWDMKQWDKNDKMINPENIRKAKKQEMKQKAVYKKNKVGLEI